jgi:cysteinyl-tRNA synthetase
VSDGPKLRLYNTLSRTKEEFLPLDPANVRMYVCGPTVYDFAHIGNARPVIVFDVLFRLLRHIYGEAHVTYARNITDVDDKINARAARDFPGLPLNEAIGRVTEVTNAQFQADVAALGNLPPTHQPRATEHIGGMVDIVGRLIARGHAYIAAGAEGREVLFDIGTMKNYGALSNRKLDEQIEGARVAVEAHKRNPGDFVLWKESSADEPGWEAAFPSDQGSVTIFGRPGWHIECSAMSMAKLLQPFGGGLKCDDPALNTFDIHGGGIDLVFPHHENEIAQSCCAFGTDKMANIWMHNGFLQVEGRKMSKSDGNFVTISELLTGWQGFRWTGDVMRLAMLSGHYRQPIDWTRARLLQSADALGKWSRAAEGMNPDETGIGSVAQFGADPTCAEMQALLADDLNTPNAIARLHWLASEAEKDHANGGRYLTQLHLDAALIGIDLRRHQQEWSNSLREGVTVSSAQVDSLITARNAARLAKDWAESDRLRAELDAMGLVVQDGKDADGNPVSTWEVKR